MDRPAFGPVFMIKKEKLEIMNFTLAIVGRPNVGKSTLFNRLAGKKLAIVDDTPGVTRDWREAEGQLFDRDLRIIDTAGLEEAFDDSIPGRMRKQTEAALAHADAVLFVVDGRAGLTPLDEYFAGWLRRQGKPVLLGVNKCEGEINAAAGLAEAYRLGLGDPIPMSAAHGQGFDDLYQALRPLMDEKNPEIEMEEDESEDDLWDDAADGSLDAVEGDEDFVFTDIQEDIEEKPIKLAIVGRPNVGKSTLLNVLIGQERVMTGPEAGLTRDAIAVQWEYEGRKIRLVDTAGLRKKGKIADGIEKMANQDTLRAIRLAQVVILVLDAEQGMEKQDLLIAQHVLDEGRALIIAVNKWDMPEDRAVALQKIQDRLQASLAQVPDIPLVTMSALHGTQIPRLMRSVLETFSMWNRRTPTGRMNRWIAGMESQHPAPLVNGRPNRLRYITQIKTRPPTFALWVSRPDELPDTYRRYLINGLRNDFGIKGVPIRLVLRTSKNPYVD